MEPIEKIEQQTEKYQELWQELASIIDALNEISVWEQSLVLLDLVKVKKRKNYRKIIDNAKAWAKELQRRFYSYYEVNNLKTYLGNSFALTDDQLQEVFNSNEQVLNELEEIKDFLNSWLEIEERQCF